MAKDKVMCPLCGSEVTKKMFKFHFEAEKYVLDKIAKEHPDWKESDGSCERCLKYYMSIGE